MINTLTQIRNRTEHSYGTAIGRVSDVVALQKGSAAGICDRHGTWGHARWAKACKLANIKPIFGVELAVVMDMEERTKQSTNFMSFLAKNNEGLKELYELVSLATEKFYYIPRLDYRAVNAISENIIILSGSTPYWESLKKRGNFFIELNQVSQANAPALAKKYGFKTVATSDNIYPTPGHKPAYEIILGDVRSGRTADGKILDIWDWRAIWPESENSLKIAKEIAESCNAELPVAVMVKPKSKKTLEEKCLEGAKDRKINLKDKVYATRLKRELSLIQEKKFEDYFHVVEDMVNFAKTIMLVGPARGSSCGSLVCYLIGITDIDPIPYDLLFERFIDVNREDLPDIDIDFQDDKRELVFVYLKTKYGEANVSRLGTINVFKPKSAIQTVAKQLMIPQWEVQDLKDSIIERSSGDSRAAFCIMDTFRDLEVGRQVLAKYPEMRYAAELEGHASHTGMHAAGIIITAEPVTTYCSVNQHTGTAMLDKYDAEKLNLLKIDALGLRTLSVIADTLEQIGKTKADLDAWPLDDKKAFEVLNKGKFSGIFQFEGYALQMLTKSMTVEHIEDLISITALARPGPLNSGGATEFIKRRTGQNPVTYMDPLAEDITRVTKGVIVYQEQVMQIGRVIGGLSWEDVSQLRKAMSKSLGKEFFDKYYEKFQVGTREKNIPDERARMIWDNINTMGSWAFNRSHAVAYGILSYWCCHLKAHHPLEFSASTLRNAKDDDQSIKILRELVKEGFTYKPYCRNTSLANWSVQNGILVGGLVAIKGIGQKLAAAILRKRDNKITLTKREENLMESGVTPWDSVFEARDSWGHLRDNPSAYGIESEIVDLETITQESNGMFVFIAKITEKDIRDHNDLKAVEKRGGRRMTGDTLYLNLTLEDDTSSMKSSINKWNYEQYGLPIVEHGKIGDWYLWKGENKAGFRKIHIKRWKKLTGNQEYAPKESVNKTVEQLSKTSDTETPPKKRQKCPSSKTSKKKTTQK